MIEKRVALGLEALLVMGEPVSYADAVAQSFQPFRVGDAWGPPWSTTWFHVRGRVPEEWRGRRVVAIFDLGFDGPTGFTCEALAWKGGKPWRGVDPNHRWLPIEAAEVDFYLEAAANPRATESIGEPEVSMLALRASPEPAFRFEQAALALVEPAAPETETLPDPSRMVTAVGHAHIDTAWEWPLREGRRKVARSWSTQLALMEEYPDFVFAASQPAQYVWMRESHPDLYRRIVEKVAAGQWEPVGGMWVEADCNLPSGEALVRQLLHGQRFFTRELGRTTKILWLPDVFGYPGNLPQIMSEADCEFFLTQKLSWNDTNKPEHHTFWWEGIDGTRVFAHFPPADTYNGVFSAGEVARAVSGFKDAERSRHVLYLYGWGDGGGGPQPEMIEAARAMNVRMGGAEDFFEQARAKAHDLAVVRGELYFELHRGTYTSQARTKRLNRRAQQALIEAEMWSVAAGEYRNTALEDLWKTLLLNQFHDILPGSSIDWVYEEAERDLESVVIEASTIALNRMEKSGYAPASKRAASSDGPLENGYLRVELGENGVVSSIWDKEVGREVLSAAGNVLELHDDDPRRWDAWDLDIEHRDSFIVVGRRFGDSTLRQTISLDGRILRFETEVDWHERHKILKVAFPVAVSAPEATYEIQFGHVRRPTHMETPQARAMFEVCAQRWADLGDGDYGVALLNDCKHGYDIHDGVMRLSLLRAPTHPDPDADQGRHVFTYALMPHPGDWRQAGVIQAAEALNSLLGMPPDLVTIDTPQVRIEAIKRAEDSDAAIVRLHEAWGEPCTATLKTTLPASRAYLCDLLERERAEVPIADGAVHLDFAPFKIKTLKLEA